MIGEADKDRLPAENCRACQTNPRRTSGGGLVVSVDHCSDSLADQSATEGKARNDARELPE